MSTICTRRLLILHNKKKEERVALCAFVIQISIIIVRTRFKYQFSSLKKFDLDSLANYSHPTFSPITKYTLLLLNFILSRWLPPVCSVNFLQFHEISWGNSKLCTQLPTTATRSNSINFLLYQWSTRDVGRASNDAWFPEETHRCVYLSISSILRIITLIIFCERRMKS